MRKRLDGRWAKQWRAAAGLGLLLFTQCSQQDPAPAERAAKSRQSAALSVNQWPLETLTATNSIAFEDRATLTGNAVVTKQATGAVLAFNAELALGFDAVLTGSVKADTLVLRDRAIITGTARYNNVTSTGTIQGGGSSPLSLPLFSIPALPTVTPGSQDVILTSSQQQTRAAGAYRDVLLHNGNGGTPTRLTLNGGLYHFKSLTVLNDAGVQCSAACEIRVQGRTAFGDRSFLKPQSGVAGLGVGNVELLIGGANGASGPAGWPAALEVNNDGQLRAYTLAPNGTVRLGHRTVLQGKVVARDVLVGFDSDAEGLQLPLISTQPVDVTVREDQPASFSVTVSNSAGVTYRWQRDGVDIQGPAGAGATYTLAHAPVSADGAQFRVKVTNAAGTVISNAATLHVIPCEGTDTTCDAFDDDCNGVNDEDFGPRCNLEGGTAVLHCGGGTVFAAPCTNGNACDGAEVCQSGACHDGADPVIDDGNPCTADSCIHPGGVQHELLPVGTDCGDGNDCNGIDHCTAAGICETRDPLLSTDPCIVDICDASTGLEWTTTPAPEGTRCDDGDFSNDPDMCTGSGSCVPTSSLVPPRRGELPGELKMVFLQTLPPQVEALVERGPEGNIKPPDNWRTQSSFRSKSFNPVPGSPEDGTFEHRERPRLGDQGGDKELGNFFSIVVTSSIPGPSDACSSFQNVEPYARTFRDGERFDIDDLPSCRVDASDECIRELLPGLDPPVRHTFFYLAGKQSVDLEVQVWERDSGVCGGDDDFIYHWLPETFPLGTSYIGADRCEGNPNNDVQEFCWHAENAPEQPPGGEPVSLCFDWATNLVDEGHGEDVTGTVVDHPLEQRYPAAFAEYQLEVENEQYGNRRLGQHYDNDGNPLPCLNAADTEVPCPEELTPHFLDENGCVPQGLVPEYLLVHFPLTPGSLSIRARLRTHLQHTGTTRLNGYNIRYADLAPDDPRDDQTYQVVEFAFPTGNNDVDYAGWTPIFPPFKLRT